MTDIYTREKRSAIMSQIRSTGSGLEQRLYVCVREALGWRWRIDLNVNTLPGQPDIVISGLRLALFADGCFYHCCPSHGHIPKSNVHYWKPKLKRNIQRDRRAERQLRKMGYRVWRVWEHDLRPSILPKTTERLKRRFVALLKLRSES